MNPSDGRRIEVVGLGESLFDRFVNLDRQILGGAPLNMAFHAHQILSLFGGCGTVFTRVGEDDLGVRLVAELAAMGMGTESVQRDPVRATGDVIVRVINEGENHYSITGDVAWDYLEFDATAELVAKRCSAVCFGTLAQRSEPSRSAIRAFLAAASEALVVCDVNLRLNFYSAEILDTSLKAADVVKLNQSELKVLSRELGLSSGGQDGQEELVSQLVRRYELEAVALTRGATGTQLFTSDGALEGDVPVFEQSEHADSVGAGDACCAGLVCGMLLGWQPVDTLAVSNLMGAFVASQPGATPRLSPEIAQSVRAIQA